MVLKLELIKKRTVTRITLFALRFKLFVVPPGIEPGTHGFSV